MTVDLRTTEPTCVAFLAVTAPYDQIPEGFRRLFGWVGEHGLRAAGTPSGVYLTDPSLGETPPRWEVRAPLAADRPDEAADAQGCGIKHVAGQVVACTVFRGPYERITVGYAEVMRWIRDEGWTVAGPPEEVYMSEPATPPQDTVTEIRVPVARA
jgi:AraC family transcriptional regulator